MTTNMSQWNAGWFGVQVGSSCWMVGTLFMGAPILSLPSLSGPIIFVLVNTIGLLFWFNRQVRTFEQMVRDLREPQSKTMGGDI